jgi:hypothetical protein
MTDDNYNPLEKCDECGRFVVPDQADFERLRKENEASLRAQVAEEVRTQVTEEIRDEKAQEIRRLETRIANVEGQRDEAQQHERELRAQKEAVEEKGRTFDRLIDKKAEEKAARLFDAKNREWQEKLDESNREIEEQKILRKAEAQKLDELRRQMTQGAPSPWGDVLRDEVANRYTAAHPNDEVRVIPKGQAGADILITPRVYGVECEPINAEVKHAKDWQNEWLDKAKQDSRDYGAALTVIVSKTLPKELTASGVGVIANVIIAGPLASLPVLRLLRDRLIGEARARAAGEDMVDAGRRIIQWAASTAFRNEVTRIVEAALAAENDIRLAQEYFRNFCRKQRKYLDRIMMGIVEVYGAIREFGGPAVQTIPMLEYKFDDQDNDDETETG